MTNLSDLAKGLSEAQKRCILALTDEWQHRGYSKVEADILWAIDAGLIRDGRECLVDCRIRRVAGQSSEYQHRLRPLGLALQSHLRSKS